jgi:hypothetical protein
LKSGTRIFRTRKSVKGKIGKTAIACGFQISKDPTEEKIRYWSSLMVGFMLGKRKTTPAFGSWAASQSLLSAVT